MSNAPAAEDMDSREHQLLAAAQDKGFLGRTLTYARLSGPGWLQSAITLGGGSLAGSLYLGVLAGTTLLWVQPFAMILGIIMLSAIGYVTLSTGERPFKAINEHVNPVLGWSWALATLMANIVWCMPQFALANGVLQQNLLPEYLGAESSLGDFWGKVVIAAIILAITVLITWSYGSGHWGIKLYEIVLKLVVAAIVLCFIAVVIAISREGTLNWGEVFGGFLPNPGRIFTPADSFVPYLEKLDEGARTYWSDAIVQSQIDKVATAAATAVGINMTFLFPYSLLRKGWGKKFRGLAIFDLATGMFIPFVLATSCVVIAAANQFHATPIPGLAEPAEEGTAPPEKKEISEYRKILSSRVKNQLGTEDFAELSSGTQPYSSLELAGKEVLEGADKAELQKVLGSAAVVREIEKLPLVERQLGAMLVSRDANRLAGSLKPLTGDKIANLVFGLGVVGMALSTITILMLISGFVLCEMFDKEPTGWTFKLCCLAAAVGVLGPFFWSKASFALAVPTSVFGLILLPIAYLTFFLLMNQKKFLGEEMPAGNSRLVWNVLMFLAAGIATASSLYMVWLKTKEKGIIAIGLLLGLALIVQIIRWAKPSKA